MREGMASALAMPSRIRALDIFPKFGYSVLMEEQAVQYSEQTDGYQETTTAPVVPAPMVERAFRLLDLLSVTEEGLTLSELARVLNMSKGSIHGLLKTLESNGAVEQIEERRFVLGSRIYDLAQVSIQRAGLRRFALPAMRRLASCTGETVCLGNACGHCLPSSRRGGGWVDEGWGPLWPPAGGEQEVEQKGVRIIECLVDEGEQPTLHIAASRGTRIHLLAAATGPFVLASWPLAQRETFLYADTLPRFTQHSIKHPQQYLARIEEATRAGISFDYEEYLIGVNAVAAPIYGAGDTLVALLWIVGFASRFRDEALDRAAQQLRSEAVAVSNALGAGK